MRDLVIATSNPHKVDEMRAIFGSSEDLVGMWKIVSLADATRGIQLAEPAETGTTFRANALIKAATYARQTGRVCLADDSGLEVDALAGAPGVISSHYSTNGLETGLGRAQRDVANIERLLAELRDVPIEARGARFVCVMVVADPAGTVIAESRGEFAGRIGIPPDVPRGTNGFGYDPIFVLPHPETRTSAELSSDEKNARSHRGAAARRIAEALRKLTTGQ